MLVFYTTNGQRKRNFLEVDQVHCYRGFALVREFKGEATIYRPRTKVIQNATVFDDDVTPPRLLFANDVLPWLLGKRPDAFPQIYTNSKGHLVDVRRNEIVMREPQA